MIVDESITLARICEIYVDIVKMQIQQATHHSRPVGDTQILMEMAVQVSQQQH